MIGILSVFASGPARDLWIEIEISNTKDKLSAVGSRKGPVD